MSRYVTMTIRLSPRPMDGDGNRRKQLDRIRAGQSPFIKCIVSLPYFQGRQNWPKLW